MWWPTWHRGQPSARADDCEQWKRAWRPLPPPFQQTSSLGGYRRLLVLRKGEFLIFRNNTLNMYYRGFAEVEVSTRCKIEFAKAQKIKFAFSNCLFCIWFSISQSASSFKIYILVSLSDYLITHRWIIDQLCWIDSVMKKVIIRLMIKLFYTLAAT